MTPLKNMTQAELLMLAIKKCQRHNNDSSVNSRDLEETLASLISLDVEAQKLAKAKSIIDHQSKVGMCEVYGQQHFAGFTVNGQPLLSLLLRWSPKVVKAKVVTGNSRQQLAGRRGTVLGGVNVLAVKIGLDALPRRIPERINGGETRFLAKTEFRDMTASGQRDEADQVVFKNVGVPILPGCWLARQFSGQWLGS